MATNRRRWLLTAGILLAATAASPSRADNFDDSMANLSSIRTPATEAAKPAPDPVQPSLPPAQLPGFTDPHSTAVLPPPPPAPPAPVSLPATPAPLDKSTLNMAPPPEPAREPKVSTTGDCKSCPPGDCKPCRTSWWQRWCLHQQAKWLGYPDEFCAPPLGLSVYEPFTIQVANADAARMMLYQYDFVEDKAALNGRGRDQLVKIASMLSSTSAPIVIERIPGDPRLAEARRLAVLNDLASSSVAVTPDRVVVGAPTAIGLRGPEADVMYQNLLKQTQNLGASGGSMSGSTGGTSGQGAGSTGSGMSSLGSH